MEAVTESTPQVNIDPIFWPNNTIPIVFDEPYSKQKNSHNVNYTYIMLYIEDPTQHCLLVINSVWWTISTSKDYALALPLTHVLFLLRSGHGVWDIIISLTLISRPYH